MKVKIYHNARCSKSRAGLELLRSRGIEPEVVEYMHAPPDAGALKKLLRLLGMSPRELIRRKEKTYAELGLEDATDEDLIEAMAEHPALIERPIVVAGDRAVVGRPTERILDIL